MNIIYVVSCLFTYLLIGFMFHKSYVLLFRIGYDHLPSVGITDKNINDISSNKMANVFTFLWPLLLIVTIYFVIKQLTKGVK